TRPKIVCAGFLRPGLRRQTYRAMATIVDKMTGCQIGIGGAFHIARCPLPERKTWESRSRRCPARLESGFDSAIERRNSNVAPRDLISYQRSGAPPMIPPAIQAPSWRLRTDISFLRTMAAAKIADPSSQAILALLQSPNPIATPSQNARRAVGDLRKRADVIERTPKGIIHSATPRSKMESAR